MCTLIFKFVPPNALYFIIWHSLINRLWRAMPYSPCLCQHCVCTCSPSNHSCCILAFGQLCLTRLSSIQRGLRTTSLWLSPQTGACVGPSTPMFPELWGGSLQHAPAEVTMLLSALGRRWRVSSRGCLRTRCSCILMSLVVNRLFSPRPHLLCSRYWTQAMSLTQEKLSLTSLGKLRLIQVSYGILTVKHLWLCMHAAFEQNLHGRHLRWELVWALSLLLSCPHRNIVSYSTTQQPLFDMDIIGGSG